ncbi:hypothetical protein [Microbacterium testaceum]|uniref:hypothetical protein n=1 Tax=Microbacterium testaceum TaxID=2033 RepID=UPI0022E2D7B1|nr:hypothetical protein [Microbacterium testaceum]
MTDNTSVREAVAAATGVPEKLLRGDTRAELEHHASQLKDAGYGADLTPAQIVDAATGRTSGLPANVDDIVSQATSR